MKRKTSYRKKRVVRKARRAPAYVPKPEVKILQWPAIDLDTNAVAPAQSAIDLGAQVGAESATRMNVYIPHRWQVVFQGTKQNQIQGRQYYCQSMKHMFRLSFDQMTAATPNPRVRVIHGWCTPQVIAQGTPMTLAGNVQPASNWGDVSFHEDVVRTNVAQQLQHKLTTPNSRILKILSDKFIVFGSSAGSGASQGTSTFQRNAREFTHYWKMARKVHLKETPVIEGAASTTFVPIQQEPIPFTAFIWDNAPSFGEQGTSTYRIAVEERSILRVIDN